MNTNAIRSTAATAKRASVFAEPQPKSSALTIAYTSTTRPAVTLTAPGRSTLSGRFGARDSGT